MKQGKQHPTVEIPDVGEMDHAWDALGAWEIDLELAEHGKRVKGELRIADWMEGELRLEAAHAGDAGLPPLVPLTRASEVERSEAGGGALAWVMHAPSLNWDLRTILWPGDLHVVITDGEDESELFRLRGHRGRDYYARKYP
jgi:hypothetical protein